MRRKKPWGGRFEGETHGQVEAFTASIHFDRRLAAHDIAGSIAHARMLGKCGIIGKGEVDAIVAGLEEIRGEIERGEFHTDPALEDIHMHIEQRLRDKIGEAGGQAPHRAQPERSGGAGPAPLPAGGHRPDPRADPQAAG